MKTPLRLRSLNAIHSSAIGGYVFFFFLSTAAAAAKHAVRNAFQKAVSQVAAEIMGKDRFRRNRPATESALLRRSDKFIRMYRVLFLVEERVLGKRRWEREELLPFEANEIGTAERRLLIRFAQAGYVPWTRVPSGSPRRPARSDPSPAAILTPRALSPLSRAPAQSGRRTGGCSPFARSRCASGPQATSRTTKRPSRGRAMSWRRRSSSRCGGRILRPAALCPSPPLPSGSGPEAMI